MSMFEMGRGSGGRASTRRSRELPGLALNHGAPIFHHRHSNTIAAPLVDALLASRAIVNWNGSAGKIDAGSGATTSGAGSRGEPSQGVEQFSRYVGQPGMSAVADGILKLSADGALQSKFSTKIRTIRPATNGNGKPSWELLDGDGESLGEFDWLIVTSASAAHPRWRMTFGEEPPLYGAAEVLGCQQLSSALERLKALEFKAVHVAMLAWKVSEDDAESAVVQALKALPFDITEVAGDDVLSKVVRQSIDPPFASVLLYSTSSFSDRHAQVYGSTGTAARMGASAGSSEQEHDLAHELYSAFQKLLLERLGTKECPAPTWGPTLHRWGSAFPQFAASEGDPMAWALQHSHVSFAGDYLAPPYACIETAMASGILAAQQLMRLKASQRYVRLANEHDREGLFAMLASPCDMFGEPADREGIDWYFDTYTNVHFEITSEYAISESDSRTVEFGYVRSWDDGGKRMQVEVTEFFTFAEQGLAIERIGYIKPPTDPIEIQAQAAKKPRSEL